MNLYLKWVGICVAVVCLVSAKIRFERVLPKAFNQDDSTEANISLRSSAAKQFSFGYDGLIAGLVWIDLLQKASHRPLAEGKSSWEYAQVKTITELDPHFRTAYYFGALQLSVLRRDRLGAKSILEEWIKHYPTEWKPLYLLGHHLYSEMQDYENASTYLLKAATFPNAPIALASLGIRLLGETGALQETLSQSIALWPFVPRGEGRTRLLMRIRTALFHLQKKEWTDALDTFRKKERREPTSTVQLDPYRSTERALTSTLSEIDGEFPKERLQEKFGFHYDPKLKSIVSNQTTQALGLDILGIYRPHE